MWPRMHVDPACWSELRSAHAAEVTQEVGVTGPRRPQLHQLYHFWRKTMWNKPEFTEMRFGFEVTMYIYNR